MTATTETSTPTRVQQLESYIEKVLETAQPEAFEYDYLIPGIVGELGEMFGQMAKAFWHKKPQEELLDLLSLEAGDVTWMLALLLDKLDGTDINPEMKLELGFEGAAEVVLLEISADMYRWHAMNKAHMEVSEEQMIYMAQVAWTLFAGHSVRLTGHIFQEVLDKNIEKLASRAARGKLKGDGDKR